MNLELRVSHGWTRINTDEFKSESVLICVHPWLTFWFWKPVMTADPSLERYSRQMRFPGVGLEGQKRLRDSRVTLCGCGALGTVLASSLIRAGVGYLRLIDRDFIETHNLQRQILFDEA